MGKELSSTLEDYLEAIYRLEKENRAARVRDISIDLGVAKSTVNAALKSLAGKGLIEYSPYQYITLTEQGRERASEIVIYHHVMKHFLQSVLALEPERAEQVACEMEHTVDRDITERFACFLAYIENITKQEDSWIHDFHQIITEGPDSEQFKRILKQYMDTMR